jgi:hypothetical protein
VLSAPYHVANLSGPQEPRMLGLGDHPDTGDFGIGLGDGLEQIMADALLVLESPSDISEMPEQLRVTRRNPTSTTGPEAFRPPTKRLVTEKPSFRHRTRQRRSEGCRA